MTRCPARRARRDRSKPSPKGPSSGSVPRSWSQTSRRTSAPARPTPSTSSRPSCWPWSSSPGSTSVMRRPDREVRRPTSSSRSGSVQVRCLTPATADRRRATDGPDQLGERGRRGRAVVVQEPQPGSSWARPRSRARAARRARRCGRRARARRAATASGVSTTSPKMRRNAGSTASSGTWETSTRKTRSGRRVCAASAVRVVSRYGVWPWVTTTADTGVVTGVEEVAVGTSTGWSVSVMLGTWCGSACESPGATRPDDL